MRELDGDGSRCSADGSLVGIGPDRDVGYPTLVAHLSVVVPQASYLPAVEARAQPHRNVAR